MSLNNIVIVPAGSSPIPRLSGKVGASLAGPGQGGEDEHEAILSPWRSAGGQPDGWSLVYPSGRSEVNQGLAVRGSGSTQATVRGVRVTCPNLSPAQRSLLLSTPDLLMLCTGAANAQSIALPTMRLRTSAVPAGVHGHGLSPGHAYCGILYLRPGSGLVGFQLGINPPGWMENLKCRDFVLPWRLT